MNPGMQPGFQQPMNPGMQPAMGGYTGPVGCPNPITPSEANSLRNTIGNQSFESTKSNIARQMIGSRCLTTAQVRDILLLFDFESTRLDIAKFAYSRTWDQGNYHELFDVFDFDSSVNDLSKHISR
jgi:hypothetical protein